MKRDKISETCESMTSVITKQRDELFEKLVKFTTLRIKELTKRNNGIENQLVDSQSLQKQIKEFLEYDSFNNSAQSGNDLLIRAKELLTNQTLTETTKLVKDSVVFVKADISGICLIGRLI